MATYAVLGSTGNCGSALVQSLLAQSTEVRVNAYCRNKPKLLRLIPQAVDNKQVHVYEGSMDDDTLMDGCIRGAKAVFLAVTSNNNSPGHRLNTDVALTAIRAIYRLRDEASKASPESKYVPPKLVLLSASCIDDHLARSMPKWFRPIMLRAASNIYADLDRAEAVMRSHDHWIASIFIKPSGLSPDISRGHRLTLDDQESFVSYLDLAAGMIEAADDEHGRYEGRNVGVVNKVPGQGAKLPAGTPMAITLGFIQHFFPWLHPYLPDAGPEKSVI
ncbi:Monooxygenase mdpK [Apiospora saccharicola]